MPFSRWHVFRLPCNGTAHRVKPDAHTIIYTRAYARARLLEDISWVDGTGRVVRMDAIIVSLVILCNATKINLFIFYIFLSNIGELVVYVL